MNLIIDIGNTRTKVAIIKENTILKKVTSDNQNIIKSIKKLGKTHLLKNCIVSSVSKFDTSSFKDDFDFEKIIELNQHTKIPFINKYDTPSTLGVDRIALASAAFTKYPNQNVLVIDAGTCITYDFINVNNEYLGGAISPGIKIRYKALHKFTANLPQLEKSDFKLIGINTESSIHSGILNGLIQEIEGIISQYRAKYQNLTVVLTGGDTNFLAEKLKSTIFANPNFLLEGLNSILIHNLDE
ncbi:MAG: type III pantothenate kinase [Flavobacteriaceae bacterium]|nr:type III pantothenate kinase [Flavobacteriaceae bacterium]